MNGSRRVTVGTRGSRLALRQTELVVDTLRQRFPDLAIVVQRIETDGDRNQIQPISDMGDKGVFVRAIERALLDRRIDLAVHSLKDVPGDRMVPGLELVAFSSRADPRDCLVTRDRATLADLSPGSRIGTSSLRRRVQLVALRPDLEVLPIRGNVDTRLRKLQEGQYDAVLLAAAGLQRLGLDGVVAEYLPVDLFVPDAGQGIMAVQSRTEDEIGQLAAAVDDPDSRLAATAERAAVRALRADCRSPIGVYARVEGEVLTLLGMAASADGRRLCRAEERGQVSLAEELGERLGRHLLAMMQE